MQAPTQQTTGPYRFIALQKLLRIFYSGKNCFNSYYKLIFQDKKIKNSFLRENIVILYPQIMTGFTEYLPYAFALIVAITFLVLLRQFVYTYINLKNKELQMLGIKSNSENKIHSYERMTLFLERIKPSNLIQKFDKDLAVHEFIYLTERSITEEFEYNASQQLYITKNSWKNIVDSKNAVVELLHKTYSSMNENASLSDFKTVFLMNYMGENDYISETIEDLRKDIILIA